MTTVDSSSRSSPGNAERPTSAASPVPRWTCCSTKDTLAQSGACSCTFFVTRSALWPTTTTVRSTSTDSSEWMTCITMLRPQIMWSGLGRVERIRAPSPAASTIAETVIRQFYRTHCRHVVTAREDERGWLDELRGEDSNPYRRHQKPMSYH